MHGAHRLPPPSQATIGMSGQIATLRPEPRGLRPGAMRRCTPVRSSLCALAAESSCGRSRPTGYPRSVAKRGRPGCPRAERRLRGHIVEVIRIGVATCSANVRLRSSMLSC